jgi:hypothetical protein
MLGIEYLTSFIGCPLENGFEIFAAVRQHGFGLRL